MMRTRARPLPAGKLTPRQAIIFAAILALLSMTTLVIGGATGAAPPVLGWTAVTGNIDSDALRLFLIIFVWTSPHFWSLALYREQEYAKVGIPMLPVTHGSEFTRQCILFCTMLMVALFALLLVDHYCIVIDEARQSVFY